MSEPTQKPIVFVGIAARAELMGSVPRTRLTGIYALVVVDLETARSSVGRNR